jgi:hypothetical protein
MDSNHDHHVSGNGSAHYIEATRRQAGLVEVHAIARCAAQELSRAISTAVQVDRVLRGIRAYRESPDGGTDRLPNLAWWPRRR